jgi:beta-galactosidase
MFDACFQAGGSLVSAFSNFNFQFCLPKINRPKMALAVSVLMVLAGAIRAQTLTDLGATAPTPGASDIAQLSTSGNTTFPDTLNYYTDNQSRHGAGEPGQTFTTGTNSSGYTLTSVSLRTAGLGSYGNISTLQPYYLHIYSVSGTTVTLLQTYTSANFIFNDGDWLQWSGLSLALAANATYAWSFGNASSATSWEAMGVATNNPYSGGQIALFPIGGGTMTFGSSHGFDAVFDLGLAPANVPSINQFTVSPTNNVFVGTLVTFTASVTGAQPLHFQWQFNSGGGFTNVAGANTNTLVINAAVTNTGSYELVLTNSDGAVTSAPVTLTVTRDTTPPTVLRAVNIGTTNVEVDFSKLLEAASATNVANYVLTNGTAISGASLATNSTTVLLTTAPLVYGSNYTLVINGVRDLAIPPNTIAANTQVSFTASPRDRVLLDAGWRFQPGDPVDVTTNVTVYPEISNLAKLQLADINAETQLEAQRPDPVATHAGENVSFVMTNYNDSAWRALDLPHDWVVELGFDSSGDGSHGFKATSGHNIGWYRRTFTLPSADAGKVMWLEFDGIYRNALIWLNGRCIGRDVSGYAPISFDVTTNVIAGGTNVLVVRVDASNSEGWFYEGAGIYRHVWLVKTDPVHVGHWGTYIATTSLVGSNATITVQTTVTNQNTLAITGSLTSTILDADGNSVTAATAALTLAAGQGLIATQTLAVANANLWSLQTPYLYNLVSTVSNQTVVADVYTTPFGVRTVRFDATNGVFINGQHLWIQGMCNHQDHAGVGSALPDRLQYFRIERLKQMGVNAYRTSHNAPTPELLEACDRLGMLVLDENRRLGWDPETLGELERMIRRDRNHPCVFAWSLANEESLQGDSVNGTAVMQAMQNLAHSLDSTRLCTAAMSGGWGSGFSLVLDVTGFNYSLGSVDSYHSTYSTSNVIGTETSSQVTDRGIYTNDAVNGYVWGYDLNPVGWGETAEVWWPFYNSRPWSSGGFCWTGFDYRGEPTPYGWPCINSHFGIMDTCGFPKDLFYYYQANWTIKPVLHLFPHWNWGTPGQPINVWAFGNCQTVELFTNGVSLGRQALNVQGHVEWDNVPYAPGTLQAIGYNNGVAVITNTEVTTGAPAQIALWPDRSAILADGRDVSVVTVAVLDAQGNIVPTASNTVTFAVTDGAIIGVGNGNPSSHEADKASQRSVFNGLAEVIIQSINQPGTITLGAASTGLTSTNITITEAATLPAPAAPTGVAAVGGNALVTVTWDIVPGATTYNLWRATTSGGSYTLIAGNIGGVNLGYTDNGVTNLTTYYYVVTANGNGASVNSAKVSATPAAIVTGLTATASNGQIVLNWNGTPGANYNVKRSTVSGSSYTTIATSIANPNYTDSSVATCQTYFYVVTITNAGNESLPSAEAGVTLPGALPPQFTSADVGGPSPAGSASFCDGQFTISGGGADIWGTADAFRFVYVYVPVSTNCDIRARVLSVQNTSGNAKAGIMIRETLAANSRHAMADVEPSTSTGIEFIWRATNNGVSSSSSVTGQTAPNWVRLTRNNNNFTAYYSGNGNTWIQIGSTVVISNMAVSAYAGLIVCSHEDGTLNTSLLDNVSASFLTNVPPVISWAVPANNSTFIQPKTITLTASATDADGTVTNVAFFNGTTLLGNVTTSVGNQYSLAWNNGAVGSYTLSARATDNSGATNNSPATINIVVQPLTLTVSGTQTSGQFGLAFQGQNGQNYVLETSTNLTTGWTPVWTNAPINGLLMFTNANATDQARFYRVSQ